VLAPKEYVGTVGGAEKVARAYGKANFGRRANLPRFIELVDVVTGRGQCEMIDQDPVAAV